MAAAFWTLFINQSVKLSIIQSIKTTGTQRLNYIYKNSNADFLASNHTRLVISWNYSLMAKAKWIAIMLEGSHLVINTISKLVEHFLWSWTMNWKATQGRHDLEFNLHCSRQLISKVEQLNNIIPRNKKNRLPVGVTNREEVTHPKNSTWTSAIPIAENDDRTSKRM